MAAGDGERDRDAEIAMYATRVKDVKYPNRSGCMTGDGKLWQQRRADLLKYIRTSTNVLQSENNQLAKLLGLGLEIKQHLQELEEAIPEIREGGGHIGLLPESDVHGFAEKLADCRDVLAHMAQSHQYFFNPNIEEYIRVHRQDFETYIKYEAAFLESEQAQPEEDRADWLVNQCKDNIHAMGRSLGVLKVMEEKHHGRNKEVIRNETRLLRAMNDIHRSCAVSETFITRYYLARGVPKPGQL